MSDVVPNGLELTNYFRYPRVGWIVEELALYEVHFGEYLVDRRALSRAQLFRALSEQDRQPGLRLGEVIAALEILPYERMEELLGEFNAIVAVEISPSRG